MSGVNAIKPEPTADRLNGLGSGAHPRECPHCGHAPPLICPRCNLTMPFSARHCGGCGAALLQRCDNCQDWTSAGLPHCWHCGALLARAEATRRSDAVGERRRVAIVFADVADSTALADRLETEAAFDLLSGCLQGLGARVSDAGGFVVKSLGDGILSLFGAPTAHGDDGERAVRAGLAMQRWLDDYREISFGRHGARPRVRIGIHFGEVVAAPVVTGGRTEYDVLGDAVNVARRVETAAQLDGVCVSEAMYRITRSRFEFRDLGAARLKGKPEPMRIYRALRERTEPSRVEAPLIGRGPERELIRSSVQEILKGQAAELLFLGPMGLGKSRILDELTRELASAGVPFLTAIGSAAESAVPLALWRRWLFDLLPLEAGWSHEQAVAALREAMIGDDLAPWAPWIAALAVAPNRLAALDPEAREQVTLGALHAFVRHWLSGRPGALVVDELSLVDGPSRRILLGLSQRAAGMPPLLLAGGAREPVEGYSPDVRVRTLSPLTREETAQFVTALLPDQVLDTAALDQLTSRSAGSPLYLGLMLSAAAESDDPRHALRAVPDTLYGVLRAELDALPISARVALETASVLGAVFAEDWLSQIYGVESWRLAAETLERRGILAEMKPAPDRELAFRHGALREVAHDGLLSADRTRLHGRAAETLSDRAGTRPELARRAALHWGAAGMPDEALKWNLQAAEYAAALFAGEEARGLYQECLEQAARLGDPVSLARSRIGLAELAAHAGEFPASMDGYRQAMAELEPLGSHGEGVGGDVARLRARAALGWARVFGQTGALSEALDQLEVVDASIIGDQTPEATLLRNRAGVERSQNLRGLGRAEEAIAAAQVVIAATDAEEQLQIRVAAGAALGAAYRLLDDWPRAESVLKESADQAEAGGDWQGAAACWINLGSGLQAAGRLAEAAVAHERAVEHARRIGDVEKIAIAQMDLGTVCLNRGEWSLAEQEFRAAHAEFQRMGHTLGELACLYNLGEAQRWSAQIDAAWTSVDSARKLFGVVDAPDLQVHFELLRAELTLAVDPLASLSGCRRAAALADELGYEAGRRLALLTEGRALLRAGQSESAIAVLTDAAERFRGADEQLEHARALIQLEVVLDHSGQDEDAQIAGDAGRELLIQLGATPWLATAAL